MFNRIRPHAAAVCLGLAWAPWTAAAAVVNVGGNYDNPNASIGTGNTANMTNDTTFGWQTANCTIPVINNGFTFTIDTGNGNALNYGGAISGSGTVRLKSGPFGSQYADVPLRLTGTQPNTITGTWYAAQGRVQLEKSGGVAAISGNVIVGGQGNNDGLYWAADHQIADSASVTLTNSANGGAYLNLNGHNETISNLTLAATAQVALGSGGALTAAHLTVTGVVMPPGVYTSANASWVTGTGQVVIGSADQPPAAPLNLQASDGTYTNVIAVRWDATAFADSYRLYRNTVSNSSTATAIGGVLTTNAYTDAAAVYGQTYFYWVTATNTHGASGFSAPDSGYLALIPAPTGLTASDGTYTDHVALAWTAVAGAGGYDVYRSVTNSSAAALLLASNIVALNYNDATVVQEQVYFYWVTARSGGNTSGFSAADSGYSQMAGGPFYDIAGEVTSPNSTIPSGYTARCTTNAYFGWQTGTCTINVYNAGYSFGIDSGGGNTLNYGGMIFGAGGVYYVGAPQGSLQEVPIRLYGSAANTYAGTTWIKRGYVLAAKNDGVLSIPGDVLLGGSDRAVLKFGANGQIGPSARITTTNTTPCGIEPNGYNVTVGVWDLQGPAFVDFRATTATVHIADCHAVAWNLTNEFQIFNWKGSASTPVYFGNSATALTTDQLAQVGFQNPAGFAAGVYHAALAATGEITPAGKVEPINPPFDVSSAAQAARQTIYASSGRSNLCGLGTPLTNGTKIVFFGDSITWLNGYLGNIQTALNTGAGTSNRTITCINRGINGGGVLQVRDGSPDSGYPGSTPQASFASLLVSDQANIAVVFIGINDVWWRGTSTNTFNQALCDIAASAGSAGVKLVLATLTVHYERPDGSNPDDPAIEVFAQITRQVAADTHATLVDLRRVYLAYLQNNNWTLHLNGSLTYASSGILTYDGVHPNSTGNDLLADHISQGIYNAALTTPTPPTGLTAVATNAQVKLAWSAAANATGYQVKRALSSNDAYQAIGAAAGTNYTDSAVTNGVLYWYAVAATNSAGTSADSATVSARPLPASAPAPALSGGVAGTGFSVGLAEGAAFQVDAMGGIQYRLRYTDSLPLPLAEWSWVTPPPGGWVTAPTNGPLLLQDPAATNHPQRFYRIEAQKP